MVTDDKCVKGQKLPCLCGYGCADWRRRRGHPDYARTNKKPAGRAGRRADEEDLMPSMMLYECVCCAKRIYASSALCYDCRHHSREGKPPFPITLCAPQGSRVKERDAPFLMRLDIRPRIWWHNHLDPTLYDPELGGTVPIHIGDFDQRGKDGWWPPGHIQGGRTLCGILYSLDPRTMIPYSPNNIDEMITPDISLATCANCVDKYAGAQVIGTYPPVIAGGVP